MEKPQPSAAFTAASPLPDALSSRLAVFADLFTRPSWENAVWLLAGAILAPGRRTVSAVLRILGRDQDGDFVTFHRVLNRARWSSRLAACRLLHLLVAAFVPPGAPIVIGLDDTIERRWGAKINARGIYRDPVRSSKGHFVKTSGLRWLSAMLLVRVPWAGRIMALPFLTVLAPSERFWAERPRAPKTLTDWVRQAILQIHRWLPGRTIVVVADSAFAAVELLAAVRGHVSVVTRLRLDANLCAPPPPKKPGRGRPPIRGKALPKLKSLIDDPAIVWQRHTVPLWYSQVNRIIEFTSGTALWYRSGIAPLPIRWVLVRDPDGVLEPQAFLCTNTQAEPADILGWFIMRWQVGWRDPPALRGNPSPSRRRDPAPMVRPRHSAHHASSLRALLDRLSLGSRHQRSNGTHPPHRRLVSKASADIQRRNRRNPLPNLGASEYLHVPDRPGLCANSPRNLEPYRRRPRPCRLIGQSQA